MATRIPEQLHTHTCKVNDFSIKRPVVRLFALARNCRLPKIGCLLRSGHSQRGSGEAEKSPRRNAKRKWWPDAPKLAGTLGVWPVGCTATPTFPCLPTSGRRSASHTPWQSKAHDGGRDAAAPPRPHRPLARPPRASSFRIFSSQCSMRSTGGQQMLSGHHQPCIGRASSACGAARRLHQASPQGSRVLRAAWLRLVAYGELASADWLAGGCA